MVWKNHSENRRSCCTAAWLSSCSRRFSSVNFLTAVSKDRRRFVSFVIRSSRCVTWLCSSGRLVSDEFCCKLCPRPLPEVPALEMDDAVDDSESCDGDSLALCRSSWYCFLSPSFICVIAVSTMLLQSTSFVSGLMGSVRGGTKKS